jgi:adenosylcobinamide kinase / adenosylcobinamide-phosphate guanylyltransferase
MTPPPPSGTPHLILGAAKSGKSSYAERLCTALPPPYLYIATSQLLDDEMRDRVRRHRERRTSSWDTLEAPIHLLPALEAARGKSSPVLVDCLTLWLTNLLLAEPQSAPPEHEVARLCAFLTTVDYPLFLVSNEVGAGIVPDNPLARRFRDLAGFANQEFASACRAVSLVVAGIPIRIK